MDAGMAAFPEYLEWAASGAVATRSSSLAQGRAPEPSGS